jgi:amino acid transporter
VDRDDQRARDAADLARLGYAQQLLREMGGFGNFALSFSVISILTGAVQLYGWGLRWGGPVGVVLGWVLVAVMTLLVALSLAELASAYPTAGALYHWSSILGGRAAGFWTAWLNTIGQFAITCGIDYGLAEFLAPMLGLAARPRTVLPLCAGLLALHGLLNHVGIGTVNVLNRLSAWYHLVGVVLLCGALAFLAPHQPLSFLLRTVHRGDHGLAYSAALALLQAQWTFTGYDASAHVSEETVDPRRTAPWGMVLAVAVSAVAGLALLVAVTLAIPDLAAMVRLADADGNAFIAILNGALGDRLGGACIWMIMGAMWFCGLGSVTTNSRMLFAFARDGGLGEGRFFAAVSPRFRTPHRAVWLSVAMAFLVGLWGGSNSAIVAMSTIALYGSYGLPVLLALRARRQGRLARGPFHLAGASPWVARGAVAWVAIITVLFVLPPIERVGYTFAGCLLFIGLNWLLVARTRFQGPQIASAMARAPHPDARHAP